MLFINKTSYLIDIYNIIQPNPLNLTAVYPESRGRAMLQLMLPQACSYYGIKRLMPCIAGDTERDR